MSEELKMEKLWQITSIYEKLGEECLDSADKTLETLSVYVQLIKESILDGESGSAQEYIIRALSFANAFSQSMSIAINDARLNINQFRRDFDVKA